MTGRFEEPEGATQLDPDELEGLRHSHVTTRQQLNELEQANVESGLLWLSRQKSVDVLTERFVLDLHKHLFGQVWTWAGTFRRAEKNIGVDPFQISVQLRNLLEDVRYWAANQTYVPHEAAVRFHHRLVFIHLFPNGKGRHARIMANAVLNHVYDVSHINWGRGHDLQQISDLRTQYIAALRAADRNDFVPLLAFVGL